MRHAWTIAALLFFASPVSSQAQPEWQTLSSEGFTSRWDYAAVAVPGVGARGSIYTFGGRIFDPTEVKNIVYDVIEVLDVASGKWSTVTPVGTPAKRLMHTASLVNGKIYLIGGYVGDFGTRSNLIEEFDPATGVVRDVTPSTEFTAPWNEHVAVVVDNKIYMFGGFLDGGWNSAVQIFDPAAGTWESKIPSGVEFITRSGLAASAIGSDIYILGGMGGEQGFTVYSLVQKYNTVTGELTTPDENMLLGLTGHGAVTLDNQIYIVGGYQDASGNYTNSDVYTYDPSAGSLAAFSYFSTSGEFLPNGTGSSVALGGNIYQVGFGTAYTSVPTQVLMIEPASVDKTDPEDISVTFDGSDLRVRAASNPTTLSLYDLCGREVIRAAGAQDARIPMQHVLEGTYLLRLQYPEHTITKKLMFTR